MSLTGECKWFNRTKGFGFVRDPATGKDYFAHYTRIKGEDFKVLSEGQAVEFHVGQDDKGRDVAENIIPGKRVPRKRRNPAVAAKPAGDDSAAAPAQARAPRVKRTREPRAEKPKADKPEKKDPAVEGGEKKKKPKKKRAAKPRAPLPRTIHWVLRCSDLQPALDFYRDVLGMRVLRHEENAEPCKITCNGRYNNAWSKTMVGYETEDVAYCLEITYNYGVLSYKPGSGLLHLAIGFVNPAEVLAKAEAANFKVENGNVIVGPDGYRIAVVSKIRAKEPFDHVKLRVASVDKAKDFYCNVLGMKDFTPSFKVDAAGFSKHAVVGFSKGQVPLFVVEDGVVPVIEQTEGRHAISLPETVIRAVYAKLDAAHIVHPLQELQENLGKLVITIIKDVDGYEHCMVNSELFDKAAKTNADFKEPDWAQRRKFIDERAGKNAGKSS